MPLLPKRLRVVLALATAALVVVPVASASAGHFRASTPEFTISDDTATWVVVSAWRFDSPDYMFSDSVGDTFAITQLSSAGDAPGSGEPTAVDMELTAYSSVSDNGLFDTSTETITGDLSSLADGLYELYIENCCRVGDVENTEGEDDFSQWVRFTKTGSAYDIAPAFTVPSLYQALPVSGDLVVDYRATDSSSAVTYSLITATADYYWGAEELACSTFVGGVLTVGPSHCTGGDVFADIYIQNTFWAVKVAVTDAAGNQAVADSLFRMFGAPQPEIDDYSAIGNGTTMEFDVYAEDDPVTSFTVTCVGVGDPADIVTGTSSTSPVTLYGLSIGEQYDCTVSATNALGTGENTDFSTTGPIVLDGLAIVIDLAVGATLSGSDIELAGTNLLADSEYTLIQTSAPVTLGSGVVDGAGSFITIITLSTSACVPGAHTLTLHGTGSDGTPRTDQVWYELSSDCRVLQFSRSGPVTPVLAATGSDISPLVPVGAILALLAGLTAVIIAGKRRTRAGRS
jgi:hypothetical protein